MIENTQRLTDRVTTRVVSRTDAVALRGFIAEHAAAGATIYTDEATAYARRPFAHQAARHSAGEYAREQAYTNRIETSGRR